MKDSGGQNDEKMSHKIVHSWCYATFFRHSAAPSSTAVLFRKVSSLMQKKVYILFTPHRMLAVINSDFFFSSSPASSFKRGNHISPENKIITKLINRVINKMLEYDWLFTALNYGLIGCFRSKLSDLTCPITYICN